MLSVPHAPRLDDQNVPPAKSRLSHLVASLPLVFSLAPNRRVFSNPWTPSGVPLPFLYFALVFFCLISPDLSFRDLLEKDGGRWTMEKVSKKSKKRNAKTAPTTAIKATNQIVINPVRDFSNFGRRRFGIEDVEQIADRRSQIGTRACIDEDTFRVTKNSSPTTQCLHKRKEFPHHRFPPMRGTFEVTVKK